MYLFEVSYLWITEAYFNEGLWGELGEDCEDCHTLLESNFFFFLKIIGTQNAKNASPSSTNPSRSSE